MQLLEGEMSVAVGSLPCGKYTSRIGASGAVSTYRLGWGLLPVGTPGAVLSVAPTDNQGLGGAASGNGSGLQWTALGAANTMLTSNGTGLAYAPIYGPAATPAATGNVAAAAPLVLATSGAAGITLTLPAAASVPAGFLITVLKVDSGAGALAIAAAGSDKISGASSVSLPSQYDFLRVISDGTANWYTVGSLTT